MEKASAEPMTGELIPAGGSDVHIPSAADERVTLIRASAAGIMGHADVMTIDSNDMYEIANGMLSDAHAKLKELEKKRKEITDPINAGLNAVRALFKPAEEHLEVAKTTLKRKMIGWQDKVAEEQRVAQVEAQRQQREEQAAAEQQLRDAELKLVEGKLSGEEFVAAEERLAEAEVATPHVPVVAKPSTGGHAIGKKWKAEVVNLPALLRYLADELEKGDQRFDKTVEIKIGQLQSFGNATKNTVAIPGVTFTEERTLSARK